MIDLAIFAEEEKIRTTKRETPPPEPGEQNPERGIKKDWREEVPPMRNMFINEIACLSLFFCLLFIFDIFLFLFLKLIEITMKIFLKRCLGCSFVLALLKQPKMQEVLLFRKEVLVDPGEKFIRLLQ